MGKVFSSGARAELAATINSTDTTLTIVDGGDLFPEATVNTLAITSGGDWFKLTLQDVNGIEIIYCRTHTPGSNTFSNLIRGQEGTTAQEFEASAVVGIRPTHGDAEDWEAKEAAIPLGEAYQFWAGDKTWKGIQQSHIAGLDTSLATKVDKVPGKQLSTEDFTTSDRNKLITIQEGAQVNPIPVTNLASTDNTIPLAASQGKVLKDIVDQINLLLQSDDSTLDELQEIVDFVKLNRDDLEALGIDSIAGLRTALDGKQPLSSILSATTASFTAALKDKLDGVATGANNYSHPTGDGNLHVPATGTSSTGKVLKAGATAGSLSWGTLTHSDVGAAPASHVHDANAITAGTLSIDRLATSGVTAGNYTKVTVDTKGRVTAGTNLSESDLPVHSSDLVEVNNYPTIRPSLNLDFANSKAVDPRITFTRSSTALRTDEKGFLRKAEVNEPRIDHDPVTGECKGLLIEESRTNLLLSSENFDSGNWIKTFVSVTPQAVIAPDGKLSAAKLVELASPTGAYLIRQDFVFGTGRIAYSIYAKAGERTQFLLTLSDLTQGGCQAKFNLANGSTVTSAQASWGDVAASILPVGNGWFRCSLIASATLGATKRSYVYLLNDSGAESYIGEPGKGLYIWGAQFEAGSFPTSPIPTPATFTSRASEGTYTDSTGLLKTAAINEARYDHGLVDGVWVPKGLLLEPQRTNLLTYSEQFDNEAWVKKRASVIANATTAPDGTLTADKLVEDTTASSAHYINAVNYSATDTTLTASVFAKSGERTVFRVEISNFLNHSASVDFDLSTATSTNTTFGSDDYTNISSTCTSVGGGWYRCTVTATKGSTNSSNFFTLTLSSGSTITYTGDGTSGIYIWGAQLEEIPAGQSPEPSSYIKTEATAVTRSSDVSTSGAVTRAADSAGMTGENFRSWYNQREGTVLVSAQAQNSNTSSAVGDFVSITDGTNQNFINLSRHNVGGTGRFAADVMKSGSSQLYYNPGTWAANASATLALSYELNNSSFSYNGTLHATDTSFQSPIVSRLHIGKNMWGTGGYANSTISRIAFYPKRLPNEQLQALTAE